MNVSKKLYQTSKLVQDILEQDKRARNSDSFLYLKVLGIVGRMKGIDINSMSIPTFLLNMNEYGFPSFETVRRSRQKIQANNPELAACDDVEAQRVINERVYRDYAKSKAIKIGE